MWCRSATGRHQARERAARDQGGGKRLDFAHGLPGQGLRLHRPVGSPKRRCALGQAIRGMPLSRTTAPERGRGPMMREVECAAFLQWALPRLRLRWAGFRRVRRQVCKRLRRRILELRLETLEQYRSQLEIDPHEWAVLDDLCYITISRLYRDKRVFDSLG